MKKFYALFMLLVAFATGVKAETLPAGKKVSYDVNANVARLEAGRWYFLKQNRGGDGFANFNGTNFVKTAVGSAPASGSTTEDLAKYLFYVAAVEGADGQYTLQNGTQKYFNINVGSDDPVNFRVYNINNEDYHFGLNRVSGDNRVDNNGNGGTVAAWGTGTITWTGGNNDWRFVAVNFVDALVNVTYNYKYNGRTVATETFNNVGVGTAYPQPAQVLPLGVTVQAPAGVVPNENTTQDVECVFDASAYPFAFTPEGTAAEQANWYTLQVRERYVKYTPEAATRKFPLSNDANLGSPYQFKFVGDPFGFKIYNKEAGDGVALGNANATADNGYFTVADVANERTFQLRKNNDFALIIAGTTNSYVNARDNDDVAGTWAMSTWTSGSAFNTGGRVEVGSRIVFTKADETTFWSKRLVAYREAEVAKVNQTAAVSNLFSEETKNSVVAALNAYTTATSEADYNDKVAQLTATVENDFYRSLNSKDLLLRNKLNTRYLDAQGTNVSAAHFAPLATSVFRLQYAGEGKYNLVTSEGKKLRPMTAYNQPVQAGDEGAETYTLEAENGFLGLHASTPVGNGTTQNYLHTNNSADVVAWAFANTAGSQWNVEAVPADLLAKAKALFAEATATTLPLGDDFGQYAANDRVKPLLAAASAADADLATVVAGVDAARNPDNNYSTNNDVLYTLNLPKVGQFFRVKTADVATAFKYFSTDLAGNGRLSLVSEATPATIFYLHETGKLVAFKDGKSVGVTDPTFPHLTTKAYGEAPAALVIEQSGNNVSKYRLGIGTTRTFYGKHNTATTDASSNVNTSNGHYFDLEAVTSLPLSATAPVDGQFFGTFFAPVAGSFAGDGVEVYYATVSNDRIELTPVAGKQVPAGTAVVFSAPTAETAVTFNVAANEAAAPAANDLRGYTVSTNAGQENDFALSTAEGKFVKVGDAKKRAFRAFLEGVTAPSGVQELLFSTANLTGINAAATSTTDAAAPIFDLTGRRVAKTQKGGVYVQNGKKFIQL